MIKVFRSFCIVCVWFMLPLLSKAQASNDTLYNILKQKDSLLFNEGFNKCNTSIFETQLSDNFEFYHDEGGATLSKTKFVTDFRQNVCGLNDKAKRVLDKSSLQVYPLFYKNAIYGAVQTGTHSFWGIEKDKPEYLTSVARFTHVWLLENGNWKLKHAVSYDHHEKAILPNFEDAASINAWLKANKVPSLAIGIIRDSVLQEIKVFGELEKGKPASYSSIHNVASITKLITTMTVLRLVSAGKWDLDEPLYHYWTDPDIANDPRNKTLTTRIILNQQSGFPNWRWELPDKKLAFINTPGTQYGYSGEGFEYLRRALEKKFKMPFDALVDEILLKPLGMTDSKLTWNDAMINRFAVPHNAEGVALEIDKNTKPNAADLFKTTVPDLAKFLISSLHNEGLTKDVAAQMVAHTTKTKDNRYIGLGWFIYDIGNGEYAMSHGGDDPGAHSICFLLPKTGDGLIIFTNSDNGPRKLYSDIICAYLGKRGQVIIDTSCIGNWSGAYAATILPNSKIVAAGWSYSSLPFGQINDFALMRYLSGLELGIVDLTAHNPFVLYPNPVTGRAKVSYETIEDQNISLVLFDVRGNLVQTFISGSNLKAGLYEDVLEFSKLIPEGYYLLQLRGERGSYTAKLYLKQ